VDYTYDALGNRERVKETVGRDTTTTDYAANRLNQYTRSNERGGPATTYAYDRNGNLTGQNGRGAKADASYRYNAQNQLTAAETNGTRMEFFYDAKGRCVSRKQSVSRNAGAGKWTPSATDSRALIYDGWSLVAERRLDGTAVANYVHGARIDEILAMVTPTATYYPSHDGLGSTVALTDGRGGVVERYRYDAFGQPAILGKDYVPRAVSVADYRFLFTGREWLASTGIYDYRNRMLSPAFSMFLQTDPIRLDGRDFNFYRYVANDPANFTDPLGLTGWDPSKMPLPPYQCTLDIGKACRAACWGAGGACGLLCPTSGPGAAGCLFLCVASASYCSDSCPP
jgi:RHS repeat-associated protein